MIRKYIKLVDWDRMEAVDAQKFETMVNLEIDRLAASKCHVVTIKHMTESRIMLVYEAQVEK